MFGPEEFYDSRKKHLQEKVERLCKFRAQLKARMEEDLDSVKWLGAQYLDVSRRIEKAERKIRCE